MAEDIKDAIFDFTIEAQSYRGIPSRLDGIKLPDSACRTEAENQPLGDLSIPRENRFSRGVRPKS
jgi:hypothetical protein